MVGAGISGLAAAYFLGRAGARVTVLEKSPLVGGALRVSDVAGLPVDEGAESLLAARPEAVALARDVGLEADIVQPAGVAPGVWSRGAVRPLPTGTVMGVPSEPAELAGLLDPAEIERVEQDRTLPGMPLRGDVAIGRLVTERMGAAASERLVEPLLGGVYAGHATELSLRATVPALAAAAERERSLLDAAAAVRSAGRTDADGPVFAGIRGGVGRLARAVADASGADIRTGVTVRGVAPADHSSHAGETAVPPGVRPRWRVETGPVPRPEYLDADAVVLAVPAAPTARLLRDLAPAAAAALAEVEQASVGIVSLALPRSAFPTVPRSSGFLVPPVEGRTVKAVTFSSVKWPWLAELAGDLVVLRASVGRHRQAADLQRTDEDLVRVVLADLATMIGVTGRPVEVRVSRWGGALPQYAVGHTDLVSRVLADVDDVPGLGVCGATYRGVGVAACVAEAQRVASAVMDEFGVQRESLARPGG